MRKPVAPISKVELDRLEAMLEGTYTPPPKDPFDVRTDTLFAALSGLSMTASDWLLAPGLRLVPTFASVMIPATLAFGRPEKPHAPHPGPWMSLAGHGFDVEVELQLSSGTGPLTNLGFDRLNTIWFAAAMIRLRFGKPILVPFLADRPIEELQHAIETSNVWKVELGTAYQLSEQPVAADEASLRWLCENMCAAAILMQDPTFNRAFRALDGAWHLSSHTSAAVISWAAVETLIRPGRRQLTDRLCRALTAYLYPAGPARDQAFTRIRANYEARGSGVHNSERLQAAEFKTASEVARRAFMTAIERRELPDVELLLQRWLNGV